LKLGLSPFTKLPNDLIGLKGVGEDCVQVDPIEMAIGAYKIVGTQLDNWEQTSKIGQIPEATLTTHALVAVDE